MQITKLALEGVLLFEAVKHGDERGFFSETFRKSALLEAGFTRDFVQDNQSLSTKRHTLRGLHFQIEPYAQDKLIRVNRGAVLDVIVDLRLDSTTFGKHITVEISSENWRQVLVPRGFAHGFQTLTQECEVQYKVTDYYTPHAERGLLWSDPQLGIDWAEKSVDQIHINARDSAWPALSSLEIPTEN